MPTLSVMLLSVSYKCDVILGTESLLKCSLVVIYHTFINNNVLKSSIISNLLR